MTLRFWVAGDAIPGIGDSGSGTVLGVGGSEFCWGLVPCVIPVGCSREAQQGRGWMHLSRRDVGMRREPALAACLQRGSLLRGASLTVGFDQLNLNLQPIWPGRLLSCTQILELLNVYILNPLHKNQHSSLHWRIVIFLLVCPHSLFPCVSLEQEEAVWLIMWDSHFFRLVTQKEISPQLRLSVLARSQLHVWKHEQQFVMESLGLQTVTLSDGTTAYVQQAVKGEYLRGPQNPAGPPDSGEESPLPRVSPRPCPPTCSPQLALQENLSLMKMGLFEIKWHRAG